MAKKSTTKTETKTTSFKSTANAKRRVERHLKKHPNDAQASTALSNGISDRKKPNTRMGWVQESLKSTMHPKPVSRHVGREYAQMLKLTKKVAQTALTKEQRKTFKVITPFDPKAVKERNALLQAEAQARKEAHLAKKVKSVKA